MSMASSSIAMNRRSAWMAGIAALAGGALIGTAAVGLLYCNGRIAGISGSGQPMCCISKAEANLPAAGQLNINLGQ